MRILIVEDEIKIRTGMSRLISAHTAHTIVGEARNGREGLDLILRLHPELVITDIRMPVMDGLEMLEEAIQAGVHCHFVVLSGYSEFEYAQKALRYGVDDYLLKPLAAEDVTAVLEKIQTRLQEEEKRTVETTEGLIRDILLGGRVGTREDYERLEKSGGFSRTLPCYLAACYVGDTNAKYAASLEKRWEHMKETYPDFRIFYTTLENTQEMFCLIQGEITGKELEEKLQRRVYLDVGREEMPVWTLEKMEALWDLRKTGDRLRELYRYGMLLGYRCMITREKIQGIVKEDYQYPKQLESQLQTAICNGTAEQLKKHAQAFMDAIRKMNCDPKYYKKAYGKVLSFVENVCHEMNPDAYKSMQSQDLTGAVSGAVTIGELERCFQKEIQMILSSRDKREDIRNYTIRRAIHFIREHYRENISLEMLADYLEITPEYLSTLFNKEVGINFSTFLKRFRISQAKRLLKGTDKKIYAISAEVGYHDPKYFNRVFKEEIGLSPGDYRQRN